MSAASMLAGWLVMPTEREAAGWLYKDKQLFALPPLLPLLLPREGHKVPLNLDQQTSKRRPMPARHGRLYLDDTSYEFKCR